MPPPPSPDFNTIQTALRWAFNAAPPGSVYEIRALHNYTKRVQRGYFNDIDIAANAIVGNDSSAIGGFYCTLNPVTPDAVHRIGSNYLASAMVGDSTHDKEILDRRGLLLDFDPVRLSGISSTEQEHEAALAYMQQVTESLTLFYGWPVPCLIDSGNGGHARYMTEHLANTPENTDIIRNTLKAIDAKYSHKSVADTFMPGAVKIDTTVFNAARIVRIPGSVARKGEHSDERPHRTSRIIRPYDPFDILTLTDIERVILHSGMNFTKTLKTKKPWEYPEDERIYRKLNDSARLRIHDWVPDMFGGLARKYQDGYRISSDSLGRDLEEDISIRADTGIKDFGVADMGDQTEGRRTPISLIAELITGGNKRDAAERLAVMLDTKITEFEGKLVVPVQSLVDPVAMPAALIGEQSYFAKPKSYDDIDFMAISPLQWLVEDFIIAKHYNLVSAATKMGKSTLARMLVASLLTGLPFLGREVERCGVMYVAYEDNIGDLWHSVKYNIECLLLENGFRADTNDFVMARQSALKLFQTYAADEDEGDFFDRVPRNRPGLDFLESELKRNPHVKVLMIDPIRFLRDETTRSRNLVTQEYLEGMDFLNFARSTGVAVFGLHHSNKEAGKKVSESSDPVTNVGGTAANGGAAGNILVFLGDRVPAHIEGHIGVYKSARIGAPDTIMLTPKNGRFTLAPPDAEIYYTRKETGGKTGRPIGSDTDEKICAFLKAHGPSIISSIATGINVQRYNVNNRLVILLGLGVVERYEDTSRTYSAVNGPKSYIWALKDAVNIPAQERSRSPLI
jgi:hypothetical protein